MGNLPGQPTDANGNLNSACIPGQPNVVGGSSSQGYQFTSIPCTQYCSNVFVGGAFGVPLSSSWLATTTSYPVQYNTTTARKFSVAQTNLTFVGRRTILAAATVIGGDSLSPTYVWSSSIPQMFGVFFCPPANFAAGTYSQSSCSIGTVTTILSASSSQLVLLRSTPEGFSGYNTVGVGVNYGCGVISVLTRLS